MDRIEHQQNPKKNPAKLSNPDGPHFEGRGRKKAQLKATNVKRLPAMLESLHRA